MPLDTSGSKESVKANWSEIWKVTARNYAGGRYYWLLMAEMPDFAKWDERRTVDVINRMRRDISAICGAADCKVPNDWLGFCECAHA